MCRENNVLDKILLDSKVILINGKIDKWGVVVIVWLVDGRSLVFIVIVFYR